MWWNEWWVWMVAGLVLAILEVVIPGWIFLGFAIGAGVTGALLLMGVPGLSGSAALILLVFAILSLIAWIVLRRVLGLRGGSVKTFDHDINEN